MTIKIIAKKLMWLGKHDDEEDNDDDDRHHHHQHRRRQQEPIKVIAISSCQLKLVLMNKMCSLTIIDMQRSDFL